MRTMSRIKKQYGAPICRRCINEQYGADLRRKHCRYYRHSADCPRCGETRHIVKRFTLAGYMKVISK